MRPSDLEGEEHGGMRPPQRLHLLPGWVQAWLVGQSLCLKRRCGHWHAQAAERAPGRRLPQTQMRQRGCLCLASGPSAAAAGTSVAEAVAVRVVGAQRAGLGHALGRTPRMQAHGWAQRLPAQLQA